MAVGAELAAAALDHLVVHSTRIGGKTYTRNFDLIASFVFAMSSLKISCCCNMPFSGLVGHGHVHVTGSVTHEIELNSIKLNKGRDSSFYRTTILE